MAEKVDPLRRVSTDLWSDVHRAATDIGARWIVVELGSAGLDPGSLDAKRQRIELATDGASCPSCDSHSVLFEASIGASPTGFARILAYLQELDAR